MAVSLEEACKLVLDQAMIMPVISQPLAECNGRILAQPVIADTDFPPFDRSPLDGFAVQYADVQTADREPVRLAITDYVPAGVLPSRSVERGTAARIMTGAKLPVGADAIIRIEDTNPEGDYVTILTAIQADKNICHQGEEFQRGAVILKPGCSLNDGALGILAMFGQDMPKVYARPRVAILATGTEVMAVNQPLTPGKIRDTNSYMLAAKVLEAGGEPVLLGQVTDQLDDIEEKLKQAGDVDLYLTTGGASIGDCDLMGQLFERLGVKPFFTRVAIKPGMPVLAGCWQGRLLIALSGNPAAAGVSFEVLVRPLLRKMVGAGHIYRTKTLVSLKQGIAKSGSVRRFIWAKAEYSYGRLVADPLILQRNGMLAGLLSANMLLDIPADSHALTAGAEVNALLL